VLVKRFYSINQSQSLFFYLRVLFSAGDSVRETYAIGRSSPLSIVCCITTPMPYAEASPTKVRGRLES
ncbi:hypothetical protein GOODEAATRI_009947, partial [Goodea atripinnis]